jgi:hypothetical protein
MGNCLALSGIMIPGSLRVAHTWIALETSMGSLSDPPLIEIVSEDGSDSCQSREPQVGQKAHLSFPPLSVARLQYLGAPWITRKPARGTSSDIPKAEADCFWHSWQWQIYKARGLPILS